MHSTCTDRLTKAAKRYVSPGTRPLTTAEAEARALAQLIKSPACDADLVAAAAREMARLIDGEYCNLIPVPDHTGSTEANARLACAIAYCAPHAEVFEALTRTTETESACEPEPTVFARTECALTSFSNWTSGIPVRSIARARGAQRGRSRTVAIAFLPPQHGRTFVFALRYPLQLLTPNCSPGIQQRGS